MLNPEAGDIRQFHIEKYGCEPDRNVMPGRFAVKILILQLNGVSLQSFCGHLFL